MPSPGAPDPSDLPAYHAYIQEYGATAYKEAIERIEALAAEMDAEVGFLNLLVMSAVLVNSEGYSEAEHGSLPALIEVAAFFLYPHFDEEGGDGRKVEELFEELKKFAMARVLGSMADLDLSDMDLSRIQMRSLIWSDGVRCSAYPKELEKRIFEVQAPHNEWFESELGISPARFLELLRAIGETLSQNYQKGRELIVSTLEGIGQRMASGGESGTTVEAEELVNAPARAFPASIDEVREQIPDLTDSEWLGAIRLIGLTQDSRAEMHELWQAQHRPLYVVGDRVAFHDLGSCLEAAYEAFDQHTRTNQSFRDRNYMPGLAQWLETRVGDSLREVFGADAVHDSLRYADPSRPNHEAEIDHVVVYQPFIFLVEDKAKQFRPKARRGDPCHLSTDLRRSIGEAFDQSSRARIHLESADSVEFKRQDDTKIGLRKEDFPYVFQVSVCLYDYNSLTTQPAALRRLNLFSEGIYPWVVTAEDIALISRFVGTGEAFVHYVSRRLEWQNSGIELEATEMDLFCAYLQTRLHPQSFYENPAHEGGRPTNVAFMGYTKDLDAWHQAEEGVDVERPEIRLELPPRVERIFEKIRDGGDEAGRAVGVGLLDLSEDGLARLDKVLQALEEGRDFTMPAPMMQCVPFVDSEMVVCISVCDGYELETVIARAQERLETELYRQGKDKGLALVFPRHLRGRDFCYTCWGGSTWEPNVDLDLVLAAEPPLPSLPKRNRPGRNDPCICGSGKKFKKCCLRRMHGR